MPAMLFLGLAAAKSGGLAAHERILLVLSPFASLVRIVADTTGFALGFVLALATFACVAWRAGLWPRAVTPRVGAVS
ncbi:hypothetical protein ACFQE0_11530 [Methylobacterium komagatae]|uniref:FUSC family protein n=1 Tax=Methylobacterium komagatae TaxID=374425 RepID=A0ABW2BJB3_9HYPH